MVPVLPHRLVRKIFTQTIEFGNSYRSSHRFFFAPNARVDVPFIAQGQIHFLHPAVIPIFLVPPTPLPEGEEMADSSTQ